MNEYWFANINNLAGHFSGLDRFMALYAEYIHLALALILIVIWFQGYQKAVVYACISVLVALAAGQLISLFYVHPRPFMVHTVHQLIPHAADASFPSDHALLAFSIAFAVWRYHRKWSAGLILIAILTGISRVYCGVHYPADIAGGAAVALVSSMAVVAARPLLGKPVDGILSLYRKWLFFMPGASEQSHYSDM